MVKFCIDKYPKGSFHKQQTPGRYMDGTMHNNLKVLAKNIVRDMTFLTFCFSSTLEVGAGKSVFCQQIGEAVTELVNEYQGLDIPFNEQNIVFHPKDLIATAFKVPKYSFIILDEWLDSHYWSELGMTLRQFFRKCRQLNLFIMVIIPNFFEAPKGYAISRSIFAIDVKFEGEFDRGYFEFYSFKKKKELYLKGKRDHDYNVVKADFIGRFPDGYAIPREVYLKKKRDDLAKHEEEEKKVPTELETKRKLFHQLYENMEGTSIKKLASLFNVSERTGNIWLLNVRKDIEGTGSYEGVQAHNLINNLDKDGSYGEEDGKKRTPPLYNQSVTTY